MPRAGRPKVRQYSLEFKLKAVKLSPSSGSAGICGAISGNTTTIAYIRRWGISRPLTMNDRPRRNHLSTQPRQDPERHEGESDSQRSVRAARG